MTGRIQRYEHARMSGAELRALMHRIEMSNREFSRLTGVRSRTLSKWLDEGDVPHWVNVFLELMAFDANRSIGHRVTKECLPCD